MPEAQVDRFMMKILIGYPSEEEEFVIVQRVTGDATPVGPVTSVDALLEMQAAVRKLYVDPSLMIYAVKVVAATRAPAPGTAVLRRTAAHPAGAAVQATGGEPECDLVSPASATPALR